MGVWEYGSDPDTHTPTLPYIIMTAGTVFDIQRFCTHDGPGIRTVVFLKGCSLDCAWCHNPESKSRQPELFYTPRLCIGCGSCASVCPEGAQRMTEEGHTFDRSLCRTCLTCVERCFSRALEIAGREMTADEALAEVEKDRVFYEESGGGLTLSGGEPMAQFEFIRAVLEGAKNLHTCIETCGFGPSERFLEILSLVDLFLWDIKDTDEARHLQNTGAPLAPILENLSLVDEAGGVTILRCPLIVGVNLSNDHLDKIASIYRSLRNCRGIELLPYHPLGDSKYARLGIPRAPDPSLEPTPEMISAARAYLLGKWHIPSE